MTQTLVREPTAPTTEAGHAPFTIKFEPVIKMTGELFEQLCALNDGHAYRTHRRRNDRDYAAYIWFDREQEQQTYDSVGELDYRRRHRSCVRFISRIYVTK